MRTLTKECKVRLKYWGAFDALVTTVNANELLYQSLITALAVFKRHITAKEAIDICRVEEEFQISNWGLVEGGHDLDRVNCAVKVSSASLLLYLLENKH